MVLQVNHPPEHLSQQLERLDWVRSISCELDSSEMWRGEIGLEKTHHPLLVAWLNKNGAHVAEVFYKQPSLEDLFLELVQVEQ